MLNGKKVVVVMPAYNAEKTLLKTHSEVLSQNIVDLVILVDDGSTDATVEIAETLPITQVYRHGENLGYGQNQKNCYKIALHEKADIIINVHPDYQYTPKLIPAMAALISSDLYSCVLASRILGGRALDGGMPLWKYISNRILTLIENFLSGEKLSEYYSGYRAYSGEMLKKIPIEVNSNDFVFDNEILLQILCMKEKIAEITCPANYFADASSVGFTESFKYGVGCLLTALKYRLHKLKMIRSKLFVFADQ